MFFRVLWLKIELIKQEIALYILTVCKVSVLLSLFDLVWFSQVLLCSKQGYEFDLANSQ